MVKLKKNSQITAKEVRVIDSDGTNIGILSLSDAIHKAQEQSLDLLEVSGNANPPVCRITDYNKYLFELKAKEKKTKAKKTGLKEFGRISPNIGEGDLAVRIRRGKEYLSEGNVVKYTFVFKGREIQFPEVALTKLKIIESELSDTAKPQNEPRLNGKELSVTFVPK